MTLGLGFTAFLCTPFQCFFMVLSFSFPEQWCTFRPSVTGLAAAEGRNSALFTLTSQHFVFVGLTVSVQLLLSTRQDLESPNGKPQDMSVRKLLD